VLVILPDYLPRTHPRKMLRDMDPVAIEFSIRPELRDKYPPPYPASRAVPDWFRQMPADAPGSTDGLGTVKRCIPFLDAMTSGYIIPFYGDARITLSATGSLTIETALTNPPSVQMHAPEQFPGAPFPPLPALKINNPWQIKTPPGYSTLFLPPVNRFEVPILPLVGVVDTDRYRMSVTFPALYLLGPGTDIHLTRGTPIVQAIPFRREQWRSAIGEYDAAVIAEQADAIAKNEHLYRDEYWQKKGYT